MRSITLQDRKPDFDAERGWDYKFLQLHWGVTPVIKELR